MASYMECDGCGEKFPDAPARGVKSPTRVELHAELGKVWSADLCDGCLNVAKNNNPNEWPRTAVLT